MQWVTSDRRGTALFGPPSLRADKTRVIDLDSLQARPAPYSAEHAPGFLENRDSGLKPLTPQSGVLGPTTPQADIVVAVVWLVIVAISRAQVVLIVVPVPAAQGPLVLINPPQHASF